MNENNINCTVCMDGEVAEATDFVAILTRDNGSATIYCNTDALTLGMAVKMVTRAFVESMHECSEEEREEVSEILGDAFILDATESEASENE